MTTPELTPDQLRRLIDEVAPKAASLTAPSQFEMYVACDRADLDGWWFERGYSVFLRAGEGFAGLSAVLILLSEGG